jgi:hypothetical protein
MAKAGKTRPGLRFGQPSSIPAGVFTTCGGNGTVRSPACVFGLPIAP